VLLYNLSSIFLLHLWTGRPALTTHVGTIYTIRPAKHSDLKPSVPKLKPLLPEDRTPRAIGREHVKVENIAADILRMRILWNVNTILQNSTSALLLSFIFFRIPASLSAYSSPTNVSPCSLFLLFEICSLRKNSMEIRHRYLILLPGGPVFLSLSPLPTRKNWFGICAISYTSSALSKNNTNKEAPEVAPRGGLAAGGGGGGGWGGW
jgi:hypothetical protein